MTDLFTTWGINRQGCGHAHRTTAAANLCMEDDMKKCREQGIETDREIREIDSLKEAMNYDPVEGPGKPVEMV